MPIDSKGHFYLVTSENMWIKELVLAVNTPALTGCSHTGIHQIAKRVHEETKLDIFAIFGGFHLLKSSHEKIAEISDGLQKMNIKKIAPCHCTGNNALHLLRNAFTDGL